MNNEFQILVGKQLKSFDKDEFVVIDTNTKEEYTVSIDYDGGGCCGFAGGISKLYLEDENNMPIITKVEADYDWEDEDCVELEERYESKGGEVGALYRLSLFGLYKPIAKFVGATGSGSGYDYGQCITFDCKNLSINKVI